MPKLTQVLAAAKDVTSHAESSVTAAFTTLQKPDLFLGQTRIYAPIVDGSEILPDERQLVQTTVAEQIHRIVENTATVMDITATRNWGNAKARSDIVVDGKVLIQAVPVEYLLFLEQRLKVIEVTLKKVPTLDPAFRWKREESDGLYHADSVVTTRGKKTFKNHVKAEATDKHPAQVETYTEEIPVGTWTTTKISGAVPAVVVEDWHGSVLKLLQAVKFAREEANSLDVEPLKVGEKLLDFIFGS